MEPTFTQDQLIGVIRTATEDVFSTMLMAPLEAEEARLERESAQSFDGVVCLIGLAGAYVGSGRIACSPALACRLSGALLACEFPAVNEDVLDAMAEITNMIIGNVKSALEEQLGSMGLSIPTVIFGRNYQTRAAGVSQWTVVPFRSGPDRFDVRICLVPRSEAGGHRAELASASI
jgi:chemotaxis protein CheX